MPPLVATFLQYHAIVISLFLSLELAWPSAHFRSITPLPLTIASGYCWLIFSYVVSLAIVVGFSPLSRRHYHAIQYCRLPHRLIRHRFATPLFENILINTTTIVYAMLHTYSLLGLPLRRHLFHLFRHFAVTPLLHTLLAEMPLRFRCLCPPYARLPCVYTCLPLLRRCVCRHCAPFSAIKIMSRLPALYELFSLIRWLC